MNTLKISIAFLITFLVSSYTTLNAQSIDDAIKMYNYERYTAAKNVLAPMAAANPTANYYLGLCELGLGNTSKAKEIFSKVPDAMNQSGVARVLFAEGNATQAMTILTDIVNKVKKKETMNVFYAANAITYSKNTNYDQAIAWYDRVLENIKTDEVYLAKGDAYFQKTDGGGQAMRQYKDYALEIAKPTNKSFLYYKIGRLWYAAEIYDSSLVYYQMAKETDATNPLPYRDLGNAYSYIGKYEKAKENYEEYMKLGDNTLEDQLNYANVLFLTKNYSNAITRVKDLMSKGVEKPYMYRVLGYSYAEMNETKNAFENLDKLFQKEQKEKIIPSDYYTYGKIYLKDSTAVSKSHEWFDKAIALDITKNKAKNIREIAKHFLDKKDYSNAAKYYMSIANNASASAEANDYYYAGVTNYVQKNFTEAEKYLKLYTEKVPTEPTAYSWLGKAQSQIDKDAKTGLAEQSFIKFSELATDVAKYKDDLLKAYSYLGTLAYNKKDMTTAKSWANKALAIDANDKSAKSILGIK